MLRNGVASALAFAGGAVVLGLQSLSFAGFSIVSQQAVVDKAAGQVSFTVDFNEAPNFTTVDSLGRHLDSFQYEIVPNTSVPMTQLPFTAIGAVVRGEEIKGGMLPIRNGFSAGVDPSPSSGGWGPVRGTVPFTLSGDTVSFDASFKVLGVTDGKFSYRLFTTQYGSTVSSVDSVSVPLPTALPAGAGLLAALIGLGWLRRRRMA